jgi:predicted permease
MAPRREIVAGVRRFVVVTAAVVVVTALVSLAVGLLVGDSVNRSLSVGFYLAASMSMLLGGFFGIRPPVRQEGDAGALGGLFGVFGSGPVRFATPEEREDSLASSAVFVVLGLVLVLCGLVCDGRHPLA